MADRVHNSPSRLTEDIWLCVCWVFAWVAVSTAIQVFVQCIKEPSVDGWGLGVIVAIMCCVVPGGPMGGMLQCSLESHNNDDGFDRKLVRRMFMLRLWPHGQPKARVSLGCWRRFCVVGVIA